MKGTERTRVLWFGSKPDSSIVAEFEQRDLTIFPTNCQKEILETLHQSRALVYHARTPAEVAWFFTITESLLDYGLLVIPTTEDDILQRDFHLGCSEKFSNVVKGKRELYRGIELGYINSHLIVKDPWKIPRLCVNWNPGPSSGTSPTLSLPDTADDELLVRRAFCDYKKIEVQKLSAGKSGAHVYKVFATPHPPVTRPLPMYAKVDSIFRIRSEQENYRVFVEPGVPFNLRPDLCPDHFALGAKRGVLAGNFVEGSEPLWKAVRRGQGHEPIYSLFDHAFKAWRLCSKKEENSSVFESLKNAGLVANETPNENIATELETLGTDTPEVLLKRLGDLKGSPHRIGIVHGDLHADNVCVRGRDAVLIDFYSVRPTAPLAFDAATLETSLAFRTYEDDDDDGTWKKTIDTLYLPRYFSKPPGPAQEQHAREWLWNTVRQLRMIALANEASPREYETVLTYTLIRICKHSPNENFTAFRRAYGCVIAQRLIENLESQQT